MSAYATQNLSSTEQRDLAATAQSGTPAAAGALEALTTAFLPAINAAAHASDALETDDAFQVAAEAFVQAVHNYDPDSETPFAATVSPILHRAVLREARGSDLVRVKDNTAAKYWRLMHKHDMDANAAYEECRHEANDFTPATFLAAHAALGTVESLNYTEADERHDVLASDLGQPDEAVIRADYVAWLFTRVDDVQESILRLRYGFEDLATQNLLDTWNTDAAHILHSLGDQLDDAEVAEVLTMARSTVNRQARNAIAAMRAADAEVLAEELANA